MADFERAVEFVLGQEGSLHIDPHDPGGLTNFGISQRSYPTRDIEHLTRDEAVEIYRRDFWRFDEVHSQPFANMLLSLAVNMGLNTTVILAQKSMSLLMDGCWGERCDHAANARPSDAMLDLAANAGVYYAHLASKRPDSPLRGWLRRVAECLLVG